MINLGDVVSFKLFNKCHIGIVCKKTPHAKKQYLVEYREYGNRLTILNNTPIRAWLRRKDIFGAIKECKMYEVKICAECGAQLERTPLVDLVKTYEVDDEDKSIFIQVWHRKCFASYETRTAVRQINAADATTEAPVNNEELLLELKAGILDAICSEDGLDGADGTYLLSGINLALGLPVDDHTSPVPAQQGDEANDIERAARVVESFARYYPPDIFTPPPPGEHGKTVDSCSAAAIREILPNIAEEIRKLQST